MFLHIWCVRNASTLCLINNNKKKGNDVIRFFLVYTKNEYKCTRQRFFAGTKLSFSIIIFNFSLFKTFLLNNCKSWEWITMSHRDVDNTGTSFCIVLHDISSEYRLNFMIDSPFDPIYRSNIQLPRTFSYLKPYSWIIGWKQGQKQSYLC